MVQASTFVKIPRERIGVLIGTNGKTKQTVENKLKLTLQIESDTGVVSIILNNKTKDPTGLFRAKDFVTAIGRGFSPDKAFRLIYNEESSLELIDLRDRFGRSETSIKRVKGRIIGLHGKTRKLIEELTGSSVSIYGNTIGIIGEENQVQIAKEAVKMLINGSTHKTVNHYLFNKRRELKKSNLELWKKPVK
jgi:ribosomal RNA assembly protein